MDKQIPDRMTAEGFKVEMKKKRKNSNVLKMEKVTMGDEKS